MASGNRTGETAKLKCQDFAGSLSNLQNYSFFFNLVFVGRPVLEVSIKSGLSHMLSPWEHVGVGARSNSIIMLKCIYMCVFFVCFLMCDRILKSTGNVQELALCLAVLPFLNILDHGVACQHVHRCC